MGLHFNSWGEGGGSVYSQEGPIFLGGTARTCLCVHIVSDLMQLHFNFNRDFLLFSKKSQKFSSAVFFWIFFLKSVKLVYLSLWAEFCGASSTQLSELLENWFNNRSSCDLTIILQLDFFYDNVVKFCLIILELDKGHESKITVIITSHIASNKLL